jgi:kynurenine formamidase
MTEQDVLPAYRDLPVKPGAPPGSSWGLWGDDDQLGTLNLLTDERTRRAAALVERGSVFCLNLPVELAPGLSWREPPAHHVLHVGPEGPYEVVPGSPDLESGNREFLYRDDYLDGFWLQGGSQWDGLNHCRHGSFGNYNGIPDTDVHGGPGAKLGVDQWARRGIVGRGVLLDVERYLAGQGRPYDVTGAHAFTVDDLEGTAEAQGVTIETGDVLLLRSGWTGRFLEATMDEREELLDWETLRAPGLEQSQEMVEYVWDHHVAAIGSDTLGVEVLNLGPDFEFFLHANFLPLLGLPLGELWALDELAEDCARDGRYSFQFVSVPLNVRGGVGSPPQAVAVK